MRPLAILAAALVALAAIALRVARDARQWREWDVTEGAGDYGDIPESWTANSITLTYPRDTASTWRN